MAQERLQIAVEVLDKASEKLKTITGNVQKQTSIWKKEIGRISKTQALGLVALGGAAIKMAADFDTAMRKVNVMARMGKGEFEKMKKSVLDLAEATAMSPTSLTEALYTVVSAGFRGEEAMRVLEIVARGAAGGMADAQATAEALTKALNIFGYSGEQAGMVMDRFFGIVDRGLLSFEELARVFPMAATQAAGLGASFDEVGAALAILTKTAGSTEMAATALNAIFTQLLSPSEELKALLNDLGYANAQLAVKSLGLVGLLGKIRERVGDNAEQMRKLFSSSEAMRGIVPLLTTNFDEFRQVVDELADSVGRTNQAFNEMAEGPGFKLRQVSTKLKVSMIEIGDSLYYVSDALIKVMEWVEKVILGFKVLGIQIARSTLWIRRKALEITRDFKAFGQVLKNNFDEANRILREYDRRIQELKDSSEVLKQEIEEIGLEWYNTKDITQKYNEISEETAKKQQDLRSQLDLTEKSVEKIADSFSRASEKSEKAVEKLKSRVESLKDKISDVKNRIVEALQKIEDRFWGLADEEMSALEEVIRLNKEKMEIMEEGWKKAGWTTETALELQKQHSKEYQALAKEVEKAERRIREIKMGRRIRPVEEIISFFEAGKAELEERAGAVGLKLPAPVYPRLQPFSLTPQQAVNQFNFNFQGAFIGDKDKFVNEIINIINRKSDLKIYAGK